MYRWEIMGQLSAQRVFGVVRAPDRKAARDAAHAMTEAGLRAVEVSMTTPGVLGAIEDLAGLPGVLVGAGTVLDESSARMAVLAGARFLVSPSLHPDVVRTAHRYGVAVVPGTGTVTEVVAALEAGADGVKLFPASAYGPGWVRDVRAALPQAPIFPTGGIRPDEVPAWIEAGAAACGLGSALTAGGADQARERVANLLATLAEAAHSRGQAG
jgi:2-dehydro-3-deoxyphosphogluconate aldolase/(4S)-4-hydroxy-2-oxoglutarate aldolase